MLAGLTLAANPYADHSDEELTRVAADWETLSTEARRDFVLEMRRRMAENGRKTAVPVEVRRRFGRAVRRADGSVVRIEQVVRIRPRDPEAAATEPDEYGKGFERRAERTTDPVPAPTIQVKQSVKED